MGEIAEMMLDGTLCEGCGEYIGSDAGYPQYCSDECAAGRGMGDDDMPQQKNVQCSACAKRFVSDAARDQHYRAKHGGSVPF